MTIIKKLADSQIIFAVVDKRDQHYGSNGEVTMLHPDGSMDVAIKDILWDTVSHQRYQSDQVLTLQEYRTKQKIWEAHFDGK